MKICAAEMGVELYRSLRRGRKSWATFEGRAPDATRMVVNVIMGGHVRLGPKDSLFLSKGQLAQSNAAYLWIDRSITLSYVKQSVDAGDSSTRRLERLLGGAWNGMSESAVLEKLQAEAARHPTESIVVKREDGVIWFDETRFNFEQGRLKSVGGP